MLYETKKLLIQKMQKKKKKNPQLAVQGEIYEEREGQHTYSDDVQDAEQTVNTVSR